ncbi:hypothetical protein AB0N05_27660 [Nocardia sp. NPDC051030]|uniref:hypothetical protein n=1 Tax=Nocardia sp. NPDC051030 TaxID=3155162 RepID=UPI0034462C62
MLNLIEQGQWYSQDRPFWEAFRTLAHKGDRSAMLAFLDTERRRSLREYYDLTDDQIADIPAEG